MLKKTINAIYKGNDSTQKIIGTLIEYRLFGVLVYQKIFIYPWFFSNTEMIFKF